MKSQPAILGIDCPVQSVLAPLVQTVQVHCDHGLHWSIQNLHSFAGIFSLDIVYLEGKNPLLMRNIQVNFGDILLETSKSSAFWDMGVNSNLKWCPCSVLMERTSRTAPVYAGDWPLNNMLGEGPELIYLTRVDVNFLNSKFLVVWDNYLKRTTGHHDCNMGQNC